MNELTKGDTNETHGKTVVTRYWFHNFSHHRFGVYSLKKQNIVNNCPKNEIIRKIIAYELSRGDKDETNDWNLSTFWFLNFPHHRFVVYSC